MSDFVLDAVKVLMGAYDVATLPLYAILQRPWSRVVKARQVRAVQCDPSDPYSPWVNCRKTSPLPDTLRTADTIPDMMRNILRENRQNLCLGERGIEKDGQLRPSYDWLTVAEVDERMENLARGFLDIGVRSGDTVVVFMETRMEWMLAVHALFRIGSKVGTLYSTLGDEGLVYGINQLKADIIVTSSDLLAKVLKLATRVRCLKSVVYAPARDSLKDLCPEQFTDKKSGLLILPLDLIRFKGIGAQNNAAISLTMSSVKLSSDDVALIMYTSGSTGTPKGVMVSHRNYVALMASFHWIMAEFNVQPGQCYAAFLPLAHLLEFTVEHLYLASGGCIGYSSASTLMDSSPGVNPKLGEVGDISLLCPQLITCVPLMLVRLQKAIVAAVAAKGTFFKKLFDYCISYKSWWVEHGFQTPILDFLLFRKMRNVLGGRARIVICGGAQLPEDVHKFVRSTFNVQMIEGYGATETSSVGAAMNMGELAVGRVGAPGVGAKLKLVDWEEGGYKATDKPNPRGELIFGGHFITLGYFEQPEETKEVFSVGEDGTRWYATGDIGEIFPDGTIKIIDRMKDLIKVQHGEYLSLGKIESQLKGSLYVDNMVVLTDSNKSHLLAIIAPNQNALTVYAKEVEKTDKKFEELCEDEEMVQEVMRALRERARATGLTSLETPKVLKLVTEQWTPESGLVTATLKVRRVQLRQFYASQIQGINSK